MKVADQAWLAAAMLHRENPGREDFSLQEIKERAKQEFAVGRSMQPGVWQHIVTHGVAQKPPSPNRARLFTRTERGKRRLFREGDKCDPGRRTGKTHPDRTAVAEKYWELLDWYEHKYAPPDYQLKRRSGGGDSRPEAYLLFVGAIPAYDLKLMKERIEQTCERVENETNS